MSEDLLYQDTVHKFLAVYRYLRGFSRQMQEEGLSGRKIAALRYLLEAGPRTIGQMRDYLYVSDSSTSELVAWLQSRGYVTRTRSEADNRVVHVDLTSAGREVLRGTPLGGVPLLRQALRDLPAERLSVINAAMTDLVHLLELEHEH
jgi:DNA-binding MarR family transcriptional regulator